MQKLGWNEKVQTLVKYRVRFVDYFFKPIQGRTIMFVNICICFFWLIFIFAADVNTIYAVSEVEFFLSADFWKIFTVMELSPSYERFSPLAMGLLGYLDIHYYAPLLGFTTEDPQQLSAANRLTFFHILFLFGVLTVFARVLYFLFNDYRLVLIGVLLVGLSDTIAFQMRTMSTLACYFLQLGTISTIYFFVQLRGKKPRSEGKKK